MNFQINTLLNIINTEIDNKSQNISKEDFLFELLKNIDNKDLVKELIEKSNLTNEQKEKIKLKLNLKNTDLNITTKSLLTNHKTTPVTSALPDFEKINQTPDKKDKKQISIESILEEMLDKNQDLNIVITNLQKLNIEEKTAIKEIKTLIVKKSIHNPILKEIVTSKEFKEVKSFKDLLNLSKKYNLNLSKIVISKQNPKSNHIKTDLPNFDNLPTQIIKTKIIKEKTPQIKTEKQDTQENKKSLLNDLLNNNQDNNTETKNLSKNKTTKNGLEIKDLHKLNNNNSTNTPHTISKNNQHKTLNDSNKTIDLNDNKEIKPTNQHKDLKSIKENDSSKTENQNFSILTNNHIETKELKPKIIEAKQSIAHFSNSLKEAVENYKPPITKLSIELNPKEIGKVEVTLKQRGNDLHIQINTNNSNTINFFTTQQQEIKNSLVNMGFTNINMSFNSNSDRKNQKEKSYTPHKIENSNQEEELIIDLTYKYA